MSEATTLKRLQVVIEGYTAPLKKEMQKAKQYIKDATKGLDQEVKNPYTNVSKGAQSTMQQVRNMQSMLRKTFQDLKSGELAEGIRLEAGIKVETDEFKTLQGDIRSTQDELDALQQKRQELRQSGGFVERETAEYRELSQCIEVARKKLGDLQEKEVKMQSTGGMRGKAWKNFQYDLEEARNTLGAFEADMRELQATGQTTVMQETAAWQRNEQAIAAAESRLGRYNQQKAMMNASGKVTQYKNPDAWSNGSYIQTGVGAAKIGMKALRDSMSAAKVKAAELIKTMPVIGRVAKESAYVGSRGFQGMKAVLGKVGTAVKKTGGFFASLIHRLKGVGAAGLSASGSMNRLGRSANNLGGKMFSLGNMIRMVVLQMAIMGTIRSLQHGFQNLAQYSSSANASISSLLASLNQLKNSFAAAFAPILNIVVPILNKLISYVVGAVNAIGQLVSALTGSGTFIRAKKVQTDYAASLNNTADAANTANSAAKEYQRTILGFDQLNVMNKQDNSAGGTGGSGGGNAGGVSPSDMFETVEISDKFKDLASMIKEAWAKADFTEIGEMVGNKLNDALRSIKWDKIRETSRKIAQSIATFLNGFIAATDWKLVGYTFGQAINTIIDFGYTFVTTFEWRKFGRAMADLLNSAIATIELGKLGTTIGRFIDGVIDMIAEFIINADWKMIGEQIQLCFTNIFKEIKIENGVEAVIGAIFGGVILANLISKLSPLITFAAKIGSVLTSILGSVGGFFTSVGGVVTGISQATGIASIKIVAAGGGIIAIAALVVAAIVDLWKSSEKFRDAVMKVASQIKDSLIKALEKCKEAIEPLIEKVKSLAKNLYDFYENSGLKGIVELFATLLVHLGGGVIAGAIDLIAGAFSGLAKVIGGVIDIISGFLEIVNGILTSDSKKIEEGFGKIGKGIVDGLIGGIVSFAEGIWDAIKSVFTGIIDAVKDLFGIHSPSTVFAEIGGFLMEGLFNGVSNAASTVINWFKGLPDTIRNTLGNAKDWLVEKGQNAIQGLKDGWEAVKESQLGQTVKQIGSFIKDKSGEARNWVKEKGSDAIEGLRNGWESVKESRLGQTVSKVGGYVKDKIGNIKNTVKEKGQNIIEGIHNGYASSKESGLLSKVSSLKDNVFSSIGSISSRVREKGQDIISGLKDGYTSNLSSFTSVVSSLPSKISSSIGNLWNIGKDAISSFAKGFTSVHIPTPKLSWDWNKFSVGNVKFSVPSFNLNWYAGGGFPSAGELFVANEAGPEMVGKMGNKNAVANSNQIVDGVTRGVKKGVIEAALQIMAAQTGGDNSGQPFELHVHVGDEKIGMIAYKSMEELAGHGRIKTVLI